MPLPQVSCASPCRTDTALQGSTDAADVKGIAPRTTSLRHGEVAVGILHCGNISACAQHERTPRSPRGLDAASSRQGRRNALNPLFEPLLNAIQGGFEEVITENVRMERGILTRLQSIEYRMQDLVSCLEFQNETQPRTSSNGILHEHDTDVEMTNPKSSVSLSADASSTIDRQATRVTQACTFSDDSETGLKSAIDEPSEMLKTAESNARVEKPGGSDPSRLELSMDLIPAAVIVVNALVMGLSADIAPTSRVWVFFELGFTIFFCGEIALKIHIFGIREFSLGPAKFWNVFDCLCAVTALVDLGFTWQRLFLDGSSVDLSGLTTMKTLRLIKALRLVRLMRFPMFNELRNIMTGLVTGLRVLFWAEVLLIMIIYVGGIVMTTVVGDSQPEFNTVPAAMFSLFRCFTDGCAAYDGTPLHERLRRKHGAVVFFGWIVSYLFVTIGIFNLIMAIFIEHVLDAQAVRSKQELGRTTEQYQSKIEASVRDLCEEVVAARQPGGITPRGAITDVRIPRHVFNDWLCLEKVVKILSDAGVDLSSRFDIFDTLDSDLNGVLSLHEVVDGLMRLRGPISKTEIVAMRLKIRFVTKCMEKMLGLQQQSSSKR